MNVSKKSPEVVIQDNSDIGAVEWQNASNVKSTDNSYASAALSETGGVVDYKVRSVVGSSVVGDEIQNGLPLPSQPDDVIYGGESALLGLTLTPEVVNSDEFGFAFSAVGEADSFYLIAKAFHHDVPASATIYGVQNTVRVSQASGEARVYHIDQTVFWE